MRGKTTFFAIVAILAILTGTAWCDMAVPISPGGGTEVTAQSCPTFSWSAPEGSLAYKVEVYEQVTGDITDRDTMKGLCTPRIAKEIPAPALSWTPSSGECLSRGMGYVWYVEGVDAKGEGQWSRGVGFQVEAAALSAEQQDAVKEVVREMMKGDSFGGASDSTASAFGSGTARTATLITPMALPPISAYGDASNTALGANAGLILDLSVDRYNTFIGVDAGRWNTFGPNNTFVGYAAGASNSTASANTYVGGGAGYHNQTGSYNTFVGTIAGNSCVTGEGNSFFGFRAGLSTKSDYNSFFGYDAGYSNDTGNWNSFLGANAGYSNTTGYSNSFVGYNSGYSHTEGYNNVFFGRAAGYFHHSLISNLCIYILS